MTIIIIDPGYHTGWAVYKNRKYLASGCIILKKAHQGLKYLQQQIYSILHRYQPQYAYIEKLYDFARMGHIKSQPLNMRAIQKYTQAWTIIFQEISVFGIPCEEIDTTGWAKKKIAQQTARSITGKKRISTHESEAVVWGQILAKR